MYSKVTPQDNWAVKLTVKMVEEMDMFKDINGKKVLITGASGGIGLEIARIFIKHGASVGLHYSGGENGKNILLRLKEENGVIPEKIKLFPGNLLDSEVRNNLVNSFVQYFKEIDVLINNAGAMFDYKHFSELDEESWDNSFALNTKAPFWLSARAFEFMKQRGGRIINVSSVNVKYGGSGKSLPYVASKAALDSLTKGFAREGAQYNILVNSIHCGVIESPMHAKILGYTEENLKKRIELILLKRAGKPIDIARMALFLASDAGNFITGQTLAVSGGD